MKIILLIPLLVLLSLPALATTYNIGPGKTYTTIGSAPWSSLAAGDIVNIYPQTAITCTTASASSGTTITCTGSTASIPYGSTVWFAGFTPPNLPPQWTGSYTPSMPYVTCGQYGSGLYGTAKGGSSCSGNTVTISNAVSVGSGVTVYFTPPYFEKLIITAQGTSGNRITVQGVADPTTGALPVLDQHNATTGPNMGHAGSTQYHDAYGFVKFMKNAAQTSAASYVTLRNLRIQNSRSGLTAYNGANGSYTVAAGEGVNFEYADNVTVINNEIVNNDYGMFGAQNPDVTPAVVLSDLLISGNHFWQNGFGFGAHQTYLEGANLTYEFNWYDQPAFGVANSGGQCSPATGSCCSQLKDRSLGAIIRYNTFYPSARMLDLVDAQNSRDQNVPAVLLSTITPSVGFSSGATSLTFTGSVAGVQVGDFLGYIDAYSGWGYANSGTPLMPTVTNVNTGTNTLTVSPGIPTAVSIVGADELMAVHQTVSAYKQTFVYSNIFDRDQSLYWAAVGAVVHYGWDTQPGIDSVTDRAGTLYFYNNTIIERWDLSAMYGDDFFEAESSADNIRADNNLIYVTNANSGNAATYQQLMQNCGYCGLGVVGNFSGGGNQIGGTWYWSTQGSPVLGTITQSGVASKDLTQLYPSGLSGRNYTLQPGSTAIGMATALPAAIASNTLGLDLTPVYNPDGTSRTTVLDVGAIQYTGQVQHTLVASGSGLGTINNISNCADGTYDLATSVSCGATPSSGAYFVGWTGTGAASACTGTTTDCSFSLNADTTLTGTFNLMQSGSGAGFTIQGAWPFGNAPMQ